MLYIHEDLKGNKGRYIHTRPAIIMGNLSCVSQENVSPIDREDISKVRRQSSKVHPASDGVRGPTPWQETSTSSHRSRKESNLSLISFRSRRSVRLFRRQSTHRGSMKLVSSSSSSSQSRSVLMKIDGQLLQKYTVHNIIGAGAFSNVIAVEDKTTATKYALKIIEKKRSFRTNVPWERELDILKRVHHPNIVHLYETHSTTSKVYFILELALGGDLGQRLSSMGHFEESKAKELLAPILDALRYLHKHGVTHRDVKLENCLFKTDKEDSPLLLSDFGLAHLRPDDKKDEGNFNYMAVIYALTCFHYNPIKSCSSYCKQLLQNSLN